MWIYYNNNPYKRRINDCVIRSISLAENKGWREVHYELSKLAMDRGTMIDDIAFVDLYLTKKYKHTICKCEHNCDTVQQFADKNNNGTYLISMKGHITCVKNGIIYDTWDCGKNLVWNVWKIC